MTGYPETADSELTIIAPPIHNPGSNGEGEADAIDTFTASSNIIDLTIIAPVITGAFYREIVVEPNADECEIIAPLVYGPEAVGVRSDSKCNINGGYIEGGIYGIRGLSGSRTIARGVECVGQSSIGAYLLGDESAFIDGEIDGQGSASSGVTLEGVLDGRVTNTLIKNCIDPVTLSGTTNHNLINHNNWHKCTNTAISGTTGSNSITTPNIT